MHAHVSDNWKIRTKQYPSVLEAATTMKIRCAATRSCRSPTMNSSTASNNWEMKLECQFPLWASVVSFQFPLKGNSSTPTGCVRIQWLHLWASVERLYYYLLFKGENINIGPRPRTKAPRTKAPRTRDPRTRDPRTKSLESCIALHIYMIVLQYTCWWV